MGCTPKRMPRSAGKNGDDLGTPGKIISKGKAVRMSREIPDATNPVSSNYTMTRTNYRAKDGSGRPEMDYFMESLRSTF